MLEGLVLMLANHIYGEGALVDQAGKTIFRGIDCKINIPQEELGTIYAIAYHVQHLHFSGNIYQLDVNCGSIEYKAQVLLTKSESSNRGHSLYDLTFIVNNMTRIERLPYPNDKANEQIEKIIYYISPYHGIPIRYLHESSYKGHINCTFVNADFLKFIVPNLGTIQFSERFRTKNIDTAFDTTQMVGMPVCNLKLNSPVRLEHNDNPISIIQERISTEVNYILSIIGFMNERRIQWYKFQVLTGHYLYTYYVNTPSIDVFERGKDRVSCIPPWEFSAFLKNAISLLNNSPYRYRMKVAFDTIARENTSEVNISDEMYLSLFSAMEGLLLIYRRMAHKENIFDNKRWKKIHHKLHEAIKTICSDDFQEEAMVAKLPELNRYSLNSVWKQFVSDHHLDIKYLWPVFCTGEDKPGLSDIRNLLIHGENADFIFLYMYAQYHVQLILERMICNLLQWPLDKTTINNKNIMDYEAVKNLSEIRDSVKERYKQIKSEIHKKE